MTRCHLACLALAAGLLWSGGSAAVEPAGGAPDPEARAPLAAADDAPDASLGDPSWLAATPNAAGTDTLGAAPRGDSGFTLGALILLLGLGGSAIALRLKTRRTLPISKQESRLDVLSSSRVGPKAYAVTAHVGGRIMLLGVTDHAVNFLTWIDPEDTVLGGAEALDSDASSGDGSEDLPDDYPGSALRGGTSAPAPAFASAHHLKRFQEVLRGIARSNTAERDTAQASGAHSGLLRGSATQSAAAAGRAAQQNPGQRSGAPRHADRVDRAGPLLRAVTVEAPNAASTLAAETRDVLAPSAAVASASTGAARAPERSERPAPVRPASEPASLRRKRQRRRESTPAAASTPLASAAPDPALEGQVAGLKRLTGGG